MHPLFTLPLAVPLAVDVGSTIVQEAYVKASNTDAFDHFGYSVAIDGDTLVVGVPDERSNATGVNGDQEDDSLSDAGAAYVFVRDGSGWSQEAYLKASNTGPEDAFGWSVDISGDTIVVGAHGEDSAASGVNGDGDDDTMSAAGAAYVFVRDGSTWSQQAYLKASTPWTSMAFGVDVGIDGDRIVVGAHGEHSATTGVNGLETNVGATRSGAAYIFGRQGTVWTQAAYLKASNTQQDDRFGRAVDVDGDTVVVGSGDDSSSTGINGDPHNNLASSAGAVHVFRKSAGMWVQEAYVKASNTDASDSFGNAVALDGERLVVGASGEDSSATGIDGDEQDNSASLAGAVYVFTRQGTSWSQEAYIKASNAGFEDHFGVTVSLSGERLVVGAPFEDSDATGVNGSEGNHTFFQGSGAAYLFDVSGGSWVQEAYVKASNTGEGDKFGASVGVSGASLACGAWNDDSNATGVNGFEGNHLSFQDAGAAYVFDLDALPENGFAYCPGDGTGTACPCGANGAPGSGCLTTSTSGAVLCAVGDPHFAEDSFELLVTQLPPNKSGLAVKGSAQTSGGLGNPVGDGLLCTSPQIRSQVLVSSPAGIVEMNNWRGQPFGTFAGAANIGAPTYYQWWFRDPMNTCSGSGFNFSNAWCVEWQ